MIPPVYCEFNFGTIFRMEILRLKIKIEKEQHVMTSDQSSESIHAWKEQLESILQMTDAVVKLEQGGEFRAAGFFPINHGTVTAILGVIMTYLIILMTWPGPEDENIPNYLKDVCCYAFNDLSKKTGLDLKQVIDYIIRILS